MLDLSVDRALGLHVHLELTTDLNIILLWVIEEERTGIATDDGVVFFGVVAVTSSL